MKRRNIAIALILCLILGMLPAFAETAEPSGFYKLIAQDTLNREAYGLSKDAKLSELADKDFGDGWSFAWSTNATKYEMTNTTAKLDTNGMFTGRPSSSKNIRLYRGFSDSIDFSKEGTYTFTITTKDTSANTMDLVCEVGDTGFCFGVYRATDSDYHPQLRVPGATNVIYSGTSDMPTGKSLTIVGEVVINGSGDDTFRVKAYATGGSAIPDWYIEKTAEMGDRTASYIGVGFNYLSDAATKDGVTRIRSVKAEYDNAALMQKIEDAISNEDVTAEEISDAFSYLVDYTGSDKEELISELKDHATEVGLSDAIYAQITNVTPDFTDGKVFAHEFEDNFDITYSYPLIGDGYFYIRDLEGNTIAQSIAVSGKKISMEKTSDFSIGTSYVLVAEDIIDFKGDEILPVSFSTVVVPTVNITEGGQYDTKVTIIWDEETMDSITADLTYPDGHTESNIDNNTTVTADGDYELSILATKGELSDTTIINFIVLPDIAPEAQNVKISIKDTSVLYETGSVLVGSFDFYDANACDKLDRADMKWYRTDGTDLTFVGEGEEYTLTEADENHDIIFEVKPYSDSLINPEGEPEKSLPFTGAYAPTASKITVDTSNISIGSALKAEIDFSDINGDTEGTHIVRWYQFAEDNYVEITEGVSASGVLEVTEDLIGKYVYATVVPVSKNKPYNGEILIGDEFLISISGKMDTETSDFPSVEISYLYDNVNTYEIGADKTLLETYVYPSGVTGQGFSTNWSTQKGKYVAPTGSATFFQKVKSNWSISWRGPSPIYRAVKTPFSMAEKGTYTFMTDIYEYGGSQSNANLDESDFRMYIGGTDLYYGYTDDGLSTGYIPQIKAKGSDEPVISATSVADTGSIMHLLAEVEVTDGDDIFKVKMWPKGGEEPTEWAAVATGEIGNHVVSYIAFTPNPGSSNGLRYFYFSADFENVALKDEINSIINGGTATEEELTQAFQNMSKYPEGDEKDAIIASLKELAAGTDVSTAKIVEATHSVTEPAVANETKTIKFKYNLALGSGTFRLKDESGAEVDATTMISENNVVLTIKDDLVNGMEYTVDASGVTDYKGDMVPNFSFITYATPEINITDEGVYSEQYKIHWDDSQATNIIVSLTTPKGETIEIANDYFLTELGEYSLTISGEANGITDSREITFTVEEDFPPVASNVSVRGFHETGATLTGSYVYSDKNNDAESISEYFWYRVRGDETTLVGTGITYTLQIDDENANLVFAVIPKSVSVVNPVGEETASAEYAGAYAPVVQGITILGDNVADKEISVSYNFYDKNNDTESGSVIKWYLEDGSEITENITDNKLTITEAIFEKKVYATVTPVTTKKPYAGEMVTTEMLLMPSKPIVSNVTITGTPALGNVLTANYKFEDPNLDIEGETKFVWKNASTGVVLGSGRTLEVTQSMAGIGITVTVIGVSEKVPADGAPVTSSVYMVPTSVGSTTGNGDFQYSGSSSGSVSSGGGAGGATATVPAGSEVVAPKTEFTDVTNHWAKEYILALSEKGIVSKAQSFRPDDSISRAEVLAMLLRSTGETLSNYNSSYEDVKAEDWFADYVQTALDTGVVSSAENFRPKDSVTREETAKIIANMLKLSANNEAEFTDRYLVSAWATDYVNAVWEAGIFKGDQNGNFNPRGMLSRAEMATVIYRLLSNGAFADRGEK